MTWINPNYGIIERKTLIEYKVEEINILYGGKTAQEYLLKVWILETRRQNGISISREDTIVVFDKTDSKGNECLPTTS